jgi:hypothetical protein
MTRKYAVLLIALVFSMGLLFFSCAGMQTKPTEANFKDPVIALDSVQLSYYEGFWYYGKAEVAMGKAPAGGGSSPVTLAFVFEITNPNSYPVKLDASKFFLFFEDYELRVVNDLNEMWIPAGKTNLKVLHVTLTPFSTFVKFLLVHAEKAKERKVVPWKLVEKWWNGLPEMAFPIGVREGTFTFSADDVVKTLAFEATYP